MIEALCPTRGEGILPLHPRRKPHARGRDAHATIVARWIARLLLACFAIFLLGADQAPWPPNSSGRFRNIDIFVNPNGQPLAAYQIEITGESKQAQLVGIEGGAHAAFKQPPYYDPRALAGSRVILAALNPGDDLPRGKTRVATLHWRIVGDERPAFSARLITAASNNEKTIPAEVSVSEGAIP